MSLLEKVAGISEPTMLSPSVKQYKEAYASWKDAIGQVCYNTIKELEHIATQTKYDLAIEYLQGISLPNDLISPLLEEPDPETGLFIAAAFNTSEKEMLVIPDKTNFFQVSHNLQPKKILVNLGYIPDIGAPKGGVIVNHGTLCSHDYTGYGEGRQRQEQRGQVILVNYGTFGPVQHSENLRDLRNSLIIHKTSKSSYDRLNNCVLVSEGQCKFSMVDSLVVFGKEIRGQVNETYLYSMYDPRFKEYLADIHETFSITSIEKIEKRFGMLGAEPICEKIKKEIQWLL